ncbi:hypothetical protein L873DRAFT_219862 [Choiromyces venosus 120613-1]|uniref:Uncharacterized protein n=1 Tax=Choiromyces venosus 120613-1 TaxID=1336337 RepID=A0A3N4JYC1_9PEZI|nr:hypothetical protein L873DRAFT_219862 [Choiromyces venosus 120613-1]
MPSNKSRQFDLNHPSTILVTVPYHTIVVYRLSIVALAKRGGSYRDIAQVSGRGVTFQHLHSLILMSTLLSLKCHFPNLTVWFSNLVSFYTTSPSTREFPNSRIIWFVLHCKRFNLLQ